MQYQCQSTGCCQIGIITVNMTDTNKHHIDIRHTVERPDF